MKAPARPCKMNPRVFVVRRQARLLQKIKKWRKAAGVPLDSYPTQVLHGRYYGI